MYWAIGFYWICAGLACSFTIPCNGLIDSMGVMLIGGFAFPAKLMAKIIQ